MKPIIEIKNLNAGYDGRTVLRDVNLTVYDRDFLGIIGPNGGGKTTLIKCILGLLKPLSGEISFTSSRRQATYSSPGLSASIQQHRPQVPYHRRRGDSVGTQQQEVTYSRFTKEHKEKAHQVLYAWDWKDWKNGLSVH